MKQSKKRAEQQNGVLLRAAVDEMVEMLKKHKLQTKTELNLFLALFCARLGDSDIHPEIGVRMLEDAIIGIRNGAREIGRL